MPRLLTTLVVIPLIAASVNAENWPQWRGPRLNGVSDERDVPLRWSATENVTWKLPLPEVSGSTLIAWLRRLGPPSRRHHGHSMETRG